MKPLTKINLIIAASVLVLLSVIYAASQLIVLKGFLTLENDSLARNASRVMDALNDDIATLGTLADDWATWDDTYTYMQGKAPDFIDKNLPDDALTRLRVNLVLLVDTQGRMAFGKAIDLEASAAIPLPDGLETYLRGHPELVQFTAPDAERQGLIVVSGVPLLVGLRPIVTSEGTGPISGTLVMGRFLNATEMARIGAMTHLDLALGVLVGPELPDDFQQARSAQKETSGLSIIAPDEEKIRAYQQMADIEGRPAVMLRVQMPRDIYRNGLDTIQYFMLSLLIIAILFGLLMRLLAGKLMSAQAKNLEVQKRYRAVVEQSGEGIIQVDIQSLHVLDANPAFCRLLGYSQEEITGLNLSDLREGSADASRNFVDEVMKIRRHTTHEGQLKRKDGSWLPVETGANVVSNDDKEVLSVVVRDITERKHAQERIHYLAHYDPVTNMPNRVLMRDRLQQDLAHAERNQWMVAVLFLDLDRFKVINDTLGHHAGDLLLQILGQRLTGCVRQGDTVSRQGGDEFVIVISEVRKLEVLNVITEKLLAAVAEPIEIYGHEVTTATSMGVSL
ncbi:MAG TPA: diguanylate cyclase, partial [Gammaproteobacteria bacterium]|nr:diguanylate cyclase [Gammaproteobacteria bacterium]